MILKKRTLSFVVLSLLAVGQCSCAGVNTLTAERPREEAMRAVLKKETSTLNMPIEVSTDELAAVLNQTIRQDLYKGSTKTRGLAANVLRNGPITVSAADNFLYVTLPVVMSLSYGMFEMKPIPLKLKFKATAGVNPDWRLRTEIYYLGLSDLLAEEVGIGPMSLKPRSILEGITQPVQKVLSDLLAKKINDLIPLKTEVTTIWNRAQRPILMDKSYNAWLKLTPREVMMYPLYAHNNKVRLSVGISTFAELVVGPEPAPQPLLPLPGLKLVNTFDKTFRIALNTNLFYKDLRAVAATQLLNRQFDSDGKSIVIRDLELYGNGDRVVVKLETQGSLDGVLYLTAKPLFNSQTGIFSLEDVDFDMQTRSLLLKSADWFLHGMIRSMIQDKLNINLTEQLEKSRMMVGKSLSRIQLTEHLFLKCDLKNLKLNDVVVQEDKISIQVYSEGESAVIVE